MEETMGWAYYVNNFIFIYIYTNICEVMNMLHKINWKIKKNVLKLILHVPMFGVSNSHSILYKTSDVFKITFNELTLIYFFFFFLELYNNYQCCV